MLSNLTEYLSSPIFHELPDKLDPFDHEAFEKEIGIYGYSYTNTMMVELGERLYFALGSDRDRAPR